MDQNRFASAMLVNGNRIVTAVPFSKLRLVIAAIPVACVNVTATIGQFQYIRFHTTWPLSGAILLSATLESIALFLAFEAHHALIHGDASFGIRIASYGYACIIGSLNYSHYSAGWRPTFLAIATGLMSVSSPWLWNVYSTRTGRARLAAMGLIEPRTVRFSRARWAWFPFRTLSVYRFAVWNGVNSPSEALEKWQESRPVSVPVRRKIARTRVARDAIAGSSENALIREWARERGYTIGDRGRIPDEIRTAYRNAMNAASAAHVIQRTHPDGPVFDPAMTGSFPAIRD